MKQDTYMTLVIAPVGPQTYSEYVGVSQRGWGNIGHLFR